MLARVLKHNKVINCEHQIVDKELNILSEKIIFQLKKKTKTTISTISQKNFYGKLSGGHFEYLIVFCFCLQYINSAILEVAVIPHFYRF